MDKSIIYKESFSFIRIFLLVFSVMFIIIVFFLVPLLSMVNKGMFLWPNFIFCTLAFSVILYKTSSINGITKKTICVDKIIIFKPFSILGKRKVYYYLHSGVSVYINDAWGQRESGLLLVFDNGKKKLAFSIPSNDSLLLDEISFSLKKSGVKFIIKKTNLKETREIINRINRG